MWMGDVQSEETLCGDGGGDELQAACSTVMQLYTTMKSNRERVLLYYYEKTKQTGATPTAQTYKLVIDAYGALEAVIKSSEQVFLSYLCPYTR
ncbi:hypothetical protein M378DRAFT_165867 [Amanita muscaria Koide BX008]|uniref:Uncharacterized protein n=1 Tax=Amanita muscaria (strain Koide BX008) TaxID=946122 RepID=A0A0C2X0V3_AMAMK|nr:hypothetical protein M378DRAFT_165867 [Amanita muscaria Koide BX008]